jgi:hypothetical protein
LTVTDSTVSSDHAAADGGGIYNGGTMTLSSSTVTKNSGDMGGGIYNSGTLTVLLSTVTGDTPDDLYNIGTLKHKQSKVGKVDG